MIMKGRAYSDLPVAVLCGGKGTRLGELTKNNPKALVDVGGRPFIHRQLDLLKSKGFGKFVLCAGHLADSFFGKMGGYPVCYSFDGPVQLGTAGAIRKALPLLGREFWVIYGDSYLDADFSPVFEKYKEYREALGCFTTYNQVNYGFNLFKREAFDEYPEEQDLHSLTCRLLAEEKAISYEMPQRFLEIGSPEGLAEVRELFK